MVKLLIMLCLSVSGLDLPDLWSVVESPPMVKQPESFLPTVNQIENMPDSESQGRNRWYLSAFVTVFLLIMLLGTTIMKIGPMLKECVLGNKGYQRMQQQAVLPTLGVEEQRNLVVSPGYQSPEQQAVLPTLGVYVQMFFVAIVFGLSLTAVSCSCFWAMMTHRLSKSSGLDWELYMALFSLVGVSLLIQAVVAVCRLPAGENFAMSAFPVACATSMIPTLSDYFDTLKDVIFSTLCLNSDRYFIKIMGICSWIYLVAIHVYFVFYRQNCLAELCGTYVPLIAVPPAPKGTKESTDGIWSGTLLPLLYKQLTPTKRELLLWENVPQAGFSIIFLLEEGGSLFVSFVNLALPAFQVILAFALFPWVRSAVGPQLGKKLNEAMVVKDFLKAQHILEEADFGEDAELLKSALPHMHFVKEMFQVEDVENLNLSKFARGVDLILKLAIKQEKPLSNDAIAEALKVNKTVTILDLALNKLTDVGVQALEAVKKLKKERGENIDINLFPYS